MTVTEAYPTSLHCEKMSIWIEDISMIILYLAEISVSLYK